MMSNTPPIRPPTPQATFDRVAPRYDLFNSLLSFGQDRSWRRSAAQVLVLPASGGRVLDLATGTSSLALAVARHCTTAEMIVGADLNESMLRVGAQRIREEGLSVPIHLVRSAGETLPFRSESFHAITLAFAIDDMRDRQACGQEMMRVLVPGGQVVLLELSLPEHPVLLGIYRTYLRLFPLVGKVFTRGGYDHLREEILTYKGRGAVEDLLKSLGFTRYERGGLTGGVATLHRAFKPLQSAPRS
jgi:demethylmenaquinone methyltransferase/2-methoxy-6-polyprenyl-1,4-benzoquinol methylase